MGMKAQGMREVELAGLGASSDGGEKAEASVEMPGHC